MTKRESGRLGGLRTFERYGSLHMSNLAKKWHEKYRLVPYDGNDFLIVNRKTGEVNRKTLNGNKSPLREELRK